MDANEQNALLRKTLEQAQEQLHNLTPLLACDEGGNGPDSTSHFQTLTDISYVLCVTSKGGEEVDNGNDSGG